MSAARSRRAVVFAVVFVALAVLAAVAGARGDFPGQQLVFDFATWVAGR